VRLFPRRDLTADSFNKPDRAKLRRLPDNELVKWIRRWRPETVNHLAGELELRHRHDRANTFRAWLALGISAVALAASVATCIRG
jgi:hypothetical protein